MKFKLLPGNVIRQFQSVPVVVSQQVLSEVLSMLNQKCGPANNPRNAGYWMDSINHAKESGHSEFYCFRSGAKLLVSTEGKFYIYPYHYNGDDARIAIMDLKMGYHLREAAKYGDEMNMLSTIYEIRADHKQLPALTWEFHHYSGKRIPK